MNKSNKTISANSKGIIISYTDSNKHLFVKFQNQDGRKIHRGKVQEIETPVFNEKQQRIYSEALYGLNIYSENFVDKMPKRVAIKIFKRCEMVQKVINRWKQEIVNHRVDNLLLGLFPKSPIVKQMVDIEADDTVKCNFSFKDLGLDQMKVAQKLVSLGLLPQNFFDLR